MNIQFVCQQLGNMFQKFSFLTNIIAISEMSAVYLKNNLAGLEENEDLNQNDLLSFRVHP